jgi:hypothetical protein
MHLEVFQGCPPFSELFRPFLVHFFRAARPVLAPMHRRRTLWERVHPSWTNTSVNIAIFAVQVSVVAYTWIAAIWYLISLSMNAWYCRPSLEPVEENCFCIWVLRYAHHGNLKDSNLNVESHGIPLSTVKCHSQEKRIVLRKRPSPFFSRCSVIGTPSAASISREEGSSNCCCTIRLGPDCESMMGGASGCDAVPWTEVMPTSVSSNGTEQSGSLSGGFTWDPFSC